MSNRSETHCMYVFLFVCLYLYIYIIVQWQFTRSLYNDHKWCSTKTFEQYASKVLNSQFDDTVVVTRHRRLSMCNNIGYLGVPDVLNEVRWFECERRGERFSGPTEICLKKSPDVKILLSQCEISKKNSSTNEYWHGIQSPNKSNSK